ncbi:steroidogenic acute regulatory protein-like [Halictus rubicundus]|uniref:steroidogenic acute regulatory protein-like n=1 Tax=Halictus rubicundus TaxID=77578 RepID=UPI00403501C3
MEGSSTREIPEDVKMIGEVMAAVQSMLGESINSERSSYIHAARDPDIIVREGLIADAIQNKMSNVRRFFCLFVTFDLLLTFLMWLICTMIAGENLESAFINQVVHYHITTSLFDIVMAAVCRFVVLLLFYALLHLNHWLFIALTTASTCAFLIAKVFLFDWSKCAQPVFQVLLILTSFVLPWVEAWFFDIRVLPQEMQARNWLRNPLDGERRPLLRDGASAGGRGFPAKEPNTVFFTPMNSSGCSDSEDDTESVKLGNYMMKASALSGDCQTLLLSNEWRVEMKLSNGDMIYCMDRPKQDKLRKIVGIINTPATTLIDLLYNEIDSSPTWNKLLKECTKIKNIDENTDIVYQITRPQAAGLIGVRDFVMLRHRLRHANYHMICGRSVRDDALPIRKGVIRAENNLTCCAAEELPNDESRCRFTWIIDTNLKGWIPQKVVESSMSDALKIFMKDVRDYISGQNDMRPSTSKDL